MNHTKSVINALLLLGDEIRSIASNPDGFSADSEYKAVIREAQINNPWFIPEFVELALKNIGDQLSEDNINKWLDPYTLDGRTSASPKTVGIVMAGNVPMVGFHDLLSVLVSGNKALCKLSSDDNVLIPFLTGRLTLLVPELGDYIIISEGKMQNFQAIIATGSNNTARYFEYYFGKYPHIIRKSRNGVAVLNGQETDEELIRLAEDVFLYFGMGCRNVSKMFIPAGYDFSRMLNLFESYKLVSYSNKYMNNYDYYRSIFLINKVKHFDNGFIMITESRDTSSPPSVIYFEEYEALDQLNSGLLLMKDQIQCIVSTSPEIVYAIPPGTAQQPSLWDYADGVDTLEFLLGL